MLKITVELSESYDEDKQEFVTETFDLELEHSLVSLSKWESEFEKPFLSKTDKTNEEVLAYIECMILTPVYPSDILSHISQENLNQISDYINKKMTATWFNESKPSGPQRETITSELIYYWIVSYQIPWEVENWHLERLFTLIRVFNAKNGTQKKRSSSEIAAERRALNEKRRQESKSRG